MVVGREKLYYHSELKRWLLPKEEATPYPEPGLYLRWQIERGEFTSLPGKQIAEYLQGLFHYLLQGYLGWLFFRRDKRWLIRAKWIYPEDLKAEIAFLVNTLEQYYPETSPDSIFRFILKEENILAKYWTEFLVAFYQYLRKLLPCLSSSLLPRKKQILSFPVEELNFFKGRFPFLVALRDYIEHKLANFLYTFLLHGSMVSRDYTGFSDVDTLLLVKEETLQNPERLFALHKQILPTYRYLFATDPLQHHGHFVLTPLDLDFYPQHFFPLVLFDYSRSWGFPSRELVFRERNSLDERKRALWGIVHFFREELFRKEDINDYCSLKEYLANLFLLPAIYYQALGEYSYKPEAIGRLLKEFPAELTQPLVKGSKIRENWPGRSDSFFRRAKSRLFFLPGESLPFILQAIGKKRRFIPTDCHFFQEIISDEFRQGCWSLAEVLLENV